MTAAASTATQRVAAIPSVPAVQLVGVRKSFGDVAAVDGVDVSIADGEFFSLLGPSGSGKTTVLRMIAGFELPTAGAILLHGVDATRRPPYERDVNTVFQDYALFPHMSVQKNVEYGLRVKGVGRAERQRRATEMLDVVRLGSLANRKPHQLSGGQRQRVALARALVNHPRVLLLDEPLGALDLKLREEMQLELKDIQRRVGITFVFVTHDQGEALSMSNRLAVFNNGRIEQVGTPAEVYESPVTEFVARFVGSSNVLRVGQGGKPAADGQLVSVRPERVAIGAATDGDVRVAATVEDIQYLGAECRIRAVLADAHTRLSANVAAAQARACQVGDPVELSWPPSAAFPVSP